VKIECLDIYHFQILQSTSTVYLRARKGKPKEGKPGGIIVHLSPDRVTELIANGKVDPYDPVTGKAMKDWVLLLFGTEDKWIKYCLESREYVSSK
jgi:hypothetical protein